MDIAIFDILKAVILGIVEGLTEFLPVSSTGHLILVNQYISFGKEFTLLFDIFIQLGAILAVVVFFWKRLWQKNIWVKAIIGVIPALILGFFFAGFIEEKLFNSWTVATTLLLGGLIILYIENKNREPKINSIKEMGIKMVLAIGLIQSLAMIPGVSRSGATIIGALALGASRIVATEFSFFLAIPTMLAASGYSLIKYRSFLHSDQIFILIVGFIISFLVALAVIKFFLNYIRSNNFKPFGWYRIVLSVIIIAYFLFGK